LNPSELNKTKVQPEARFCPSKPERFASAPRRRRRRAASSTSWSEHRYSKTLTSCSLMLEPTRKLYGANQKNLGAYNEIELLAEEL